MQAELSTIEANNIWTMTTLLPVKNPIGCKWVFKIKLKADGSIECYKSCLVVKGYTQTEGLEVARSKDGITLYQRKYALEILGDSGFLGAKTTKSPMDTCQKLRKDDDVPLVDPAVYRRLVGHLLYLTSTRPDLSFVLQQLSQFMDKCTSVYLQASLRVLRYLKGSPTSGLFFPASSKLRLSAFSDSNWAWCPDTCKFVSGFCIFLRSSLISWKSKKQNTISRSFSEAEYQALASVTCELQWLTYLLRDMHVTTFGPVFLFCDNKSALQLAANPIFHERTKHVETDCHIIREKVMAGLLHLMHCQSADQLADIFTKPLGVAFFHNIISKLGMSIINSLACGGLLTLTPATARAFQKIP